MQKVGNQTIQAILGHGFSETNLYRVETFLSPTSIASLRLMQIISFQKKGRLRGRHGVDVMYEDNVVYLLVKE
jgi:RimJ/RimL family protein N-acetyltransferase